MSSSSNPPVCSPEKEERSEMKIEIQCMENKQPLAASCSSASEGSGCFFLKSPEIATPATVSSFPRRTSGPMRRAKGGWTPEEVSGCFCFIILLVSGATSFDYVSCMYKDYCSLE
ncbi:Homeodomain-like superfamily protein [Arabidopsis thaliana]|jgi:myb proto-oncogene protein|uniref:Homeodomain-like superfamily protein n=1 Tax=Arabidopsis thaliana TaxID=3702 RepID=A0A1P8AXX4_ARATH|nr:Homeodomain-like superfamily protein [Arabidopsis thaliana]ANM61506.1 Homeodomain-like superfamily protein [Arabidopsis thaliana]|eukprot:NP_001323722.1 Homeodomain-like superfamily protein [Arabidopsis thaliana]